MNDDIDTPPAIEPISEPTVEPALTPDITPVATAPNTETPAPTPEVSAIPHQNTPGVIILQWLSYAFWGWLILALIWLMSVIFINAITGDSVSDTVPYAIAASVVLLPIAFVTDLFYRKHEPVKKTGAAMVVMVIHAVLFALLGIISLIVAVFNGLNAVIEGSSDVDSQMVFLYTALGATLLYAAAFIRALNPFKTKKPVLIYSIAMVGITLLLLALTVAGPLVRTITTKDDRRIEQNLSYVSTGISNYVDANGKLPTNLNEVTFQNSEAQLLVKDGLVNYKAGTSLPAKNNTGYTQHRYQLCVTFKEAGDDTTPGYTPSYNRDEDYSSSLSTYGHGKGEVCYKQGVLTEVETTSLNTLNLYKVDLSN